MPFLGLSAWLLSLGIVIYAVKESFSDKSSFLDKEFENERARLGSKMEYNRIQGGLWVGVLVRLLIITEEEIMKNDPTGRASYNLKYGLAFLLWLPTSWFMCSLILFNLLEL